MVGARGRCNSGAGCGGCPGCAGVLADWLASNFAGWLALLVEHGVPLPEAVEISAEATGDPALTDSARRVAASAREGQPAARAIRSGGSALPPASLDDRRGRPPGLACPGLGTPPTRTDAALRRADHLRTVLPTLLIVLIGGTAAGAYALALFVPWTRLLDALASPRS